MEKVFVAELKERDHVDCPFLVRDKIMAMAKNGKPYMTLKLMDRSGEVEGRVWDRVDEFDRQFQKDDFIRVRAKASVYMGKMQLIVQDIVVVPEDSVDLGDFLPVSQNDPQTMLAEAR
ncbi:MAG: HD family phosphohydrolase, partial [Deltaproteobacteria bacterium]|nr:HD family phosphohydrolase [Deltaproteobacteria bacterium]